MPICIIALYTDGKYLNWCNTSNVLTVCTYFKRVDMVHDSSVHWWRLFLLSPSKYASLSFEKLQTQHAYELLYVGPRTYDIAPQLSNFFHIIRIRYVYDQKGTRTQSTETLWWEKVYLRMLFKCIVGIYLSILRRYIFFRAFLFPLFIFIVWFWSGSTSKP